MRKIDFLSSGLIISLFLFGCSPSNKVKEYMLNDYQFSAAKDNANDIIRLTMNKDNTYEFCYKKRTSINNFDIKIMINGNLFVLLLTKGRITILLIKT